MCAACYMVHIYKTVPGQREKQDARAKEWRAAHPERAKAIVQKSLKKQDPNAKRNRTLRRKYGITSEDYDAILVRQEGRCAICRLQPAEGKKLHVDHCHESGRVRGLLCHQCNWYMGKVDRDEGLLSRLLAYKETPK